MFYHTKEKLVYEAIGFSVDEFKAYLLREKPEFLYNYQYSGTQALYKLSNIDDSGLEVSGLALADKTPVRKTWEQFYKSVRTGGLTNLYICANNERSEFVTTPKPKVIYTEQQKADAAEARFLLEKAIGLLPEKYLRRLSNVLSDITSDVFNNEPYGDPIYDAYKQATTKTTITTCHLITGSIIEYDGMAPNEKAKAHYSDTNVWVMLGYGKTHECDGVRVSPEAGWFYKLK